MGAEAGGAWGAEDGPDDTGPYSPSGGGGAPDGFLLGFLKPASIGLKEAGPPSPGLEGGGAERGSGAAGKEEGW